MHELNTHNKYNKTNIEEDVAEKFSKTLDQIPGFRDRNTSAPVVEWVQANQTRKIATWVAGVSFMAGLATYVSVRILGSGNTQKSQPRERSDLRHHENRLKKAS